MRLWPLVLTLTCTYALAQPVAEITRSMSEHQHRLSGQVSHLTEPVRYRLSLNKQGPSGSSYLEQGGHLKVTTGPQQTSSIQISIQDHDHYQVTLTLFNAEGTLSETVLNYPD